ncbi:phosphotransferase family protein [Nocardioides eburneiflavus]|uniref:phosphotransferase family protein n=1 Tax=Nocardioides eburneiflavus TaxID=2518372 RepID=UPI001FE72DC5|nr:aminoglycoside phosphotransferase family protein [Nocardioides eburneiflavus]
MSEPTTSLTPLAGGHSGRTFLGDAGGERVVVRLHPPDDVRGAQAPEIDCSVLGLVRGLLPVADVLEVRRPMADAGTPGLLVTSFLPGERGDVVVERLVAAGDSDGLRRIGRALGAVAAGLAGMPMLRPGPFLDADLTLGRFPDDDLAAWAAARLPGWPAGLRRNLSQVCRRAQDLLDTVGRACLVHSDLNPKNVLVDPATLEVTGVLDWEYAHAGHPWTDLGNLLRFDRHPAYASGALDAWVSLRGGEAATVLDGARSADLRALVDLAGRVGENPVADRAEELLRAIADAGDVHAWPFAG